MIGPQTLSPIGRGSAAQIVFTCTSNGSIAGQNFGWYLRHEYGNPVLAAAKDTQLLGGIAYTSLGSVSTPGVLTVSLARADTLQDPWNWYWTFERIDAGLEDVLAWGTLPIVGSARA